MTQHTQALKASLIEDVVRTVSARLGDEGAGELTRFVRSFYANVPPDDIVESNPDDLAGAALSLWAFGRDREAGEAIIRVLTPRLDVHGWQSPHTVVEIVNDDMPFLVDSVTNALARMGLMVHLVVHPIIHVARGPDGDLRRLSSPPGGAPGAGREPTDAATASAAQRPGKELERGVAIATVADDSRDGGQAAGGFVSADDVGADVQIIGESWMHVQVDEQSDHAVLEEVRVRLAEVLADVRAAVEDWAPMQARLVETLDALAESPPPLPADELEEGRAFLQWLEANHFTFLGFREYIFPHGGSKERLNVVPGSGLGILRDDDARFFEGTRNLKTLPPEVRDFVQQPTLLLIAKGNRRATVHRNAFMDAVGIKKFGQDGEVVGELLFAGLFTSEAYSLSPRSIPLLRRKVSSVMEAAGFPPASHDAKRLRFILETFPRDELFQISEEDLLEMGRGMLHLQERQRIALFVRRDPFERFVSCMVYVPSERHSTELRKRLIAIAEEGFGGECISFTTELDQDSVLARVHFIIRLDSDVEPKFTVPEIEARMVEAGRLWTDVLSETLRDAHGEERGLQLFGRYGEAFPPAFQAQFGAQVAVHDIAKCETVLASERLAMHFYRSFQARADSARFKIYHLSAPVPLSDVLPVLENMGLKVVSEVPYALRPADAAPIWVHDFDVRRSDGGAIDLEAIRPAFEAAFERVWSGVMEDDGLNRLVLVAGLEWRQVGLLRAYAKFLRQARSPFSQEYMEDALARHPDFVRGLVSLFCARLDPDLAAEGAVPARDDTGRLQAAALPVGDSTDGAPAPSQSDATAITRIEADLEALLDAVSSLDDDRILRRFADLVHATLRTNFFQPGADGEPKAYLSLKIDSRRLKWLPSPRPNVEVFVCSPRVEAVHLRGGKVARGGIRWSDRREDFRTEVLGLVKAQQVKNAVIVPVGSKGGFVLKQPPAEGGRDALQADAIACYSTLIRGMLDITDNIVRGHISPPPGVVRRDDDDPYLVVAADKGTATFSDIANAISQEYGFWLDDAFASGGSAGYDHKRMGITARGAWECVKRHFRELGRDIQTEPFAVAGVGDMSGDVFGNGMLLSRSARLVAAFNHLHIFVDPNPDPEVSFAERRRLFALPRSSWADYDRAKLSPGGAVFDRSAKSVQLSPEIRELLGLDQVQIAPGDLIRAILTAEVDLLWFGGIGTFVKASSETDADAGDRANDGLRIDADALRAKVVGEGANLGVTQRGRIEFALAGGRINTDAVDNSAGVDCSDHEVNIKILLGDALERQELTRRQRDELLAAMTDEVAQHVLRHNYLQSQRLTLAAARGSAGIARAGAMMRAMERQGRLDRALEYLPDEEVLADRAAKHRGLTRPELAVLLAYAKMSLYDALLESDLPDAPLLEADLAAYFPAPLRERFVDALRRHRLRREIVATVLTNEVIDRAGITFAHDIARRTGCGAADVVRAYLIVRDVYGLPELWSAIEALDTVTPASVQTTLLLEIDRLIERASLWFLRTAPRPIDIAVEVGAHRPAVEKASAALPQILAADGMTALDARVAELAAAGAPEKLVRRVARLEHLLSALDFADIAARSGRDVGEVARVYFATGERFTFDWLRRQARAMATDGAWETLALSAVVDDLDSSQSDLTEAIIAHAAPSDPAGASVAAWSSANPDAVAFTDDLLADVRTTGAVDLALLTVVGRQLRSLAQSGRAGGRPGVRQNE